MIAKGVARLIACTYLCPVAKGEGPRGRHRAVEGLGLVKALGWDVVGIGWAYHKHSTQNREGEIGIFEYEKKIREMLEEGSVDDQEIRRLADKVYVPGYKNLGGGVLAFDYEHETDDEAVDAEEWTNEHLREHIAYDSIIPVRTISKSRYFSIGVIQKIKEKLCERQTQVVFINTFLNASQKNNLREEWDNVKIVDRFEIILQIFSQRSSTPIAKAQLALAFLDYVKTRMGSRGGMGIHSFNSLKNINILSPEYSGTVRGGRQRGEIGVLGGEGETEKTLQRNQLMEHRRKFLDIVEREKENILRRNTQNQGLDKRDAQVAIIGYTNVGKSALLNSLKGEKVALSRNILFQTLNTKASRVQLDPNLYFVGVDTVGFISDLPHQLVDSFMSTLEGLREADILLLVTDASDPDIDMQESTVFKVLHEMGFTEEDLATRIIKVYNKVDLLKAQRPRLSGEIQTSATTGEGIDDLKIAIKNRINSIKERRLRYFNYPLEEHEARALWLKTNAGLKQLDDIKIDEKNNTIEWFAYLEDRIYRMYEKEFEKEIYDQKYKGMHRDQPPKGW